MSGRVRVDETDFRILREIFLQENASLSGERVPIDAIAKTLSLHRNTVSQRIRRLTDQGVFLPASLDVEPARLGLVSAIVHLDAPPERRTDASREALFAIPGVQTLIMMTDGWNVIAYGETADALTSRIDAMRQAVGAAHARVEVWSPRDYAPAERAKLTELDKKLLIELLRDARAPFPALAERTGTTAMTAQRRYEKLRDDGTLYLLPSTSAPIEGLTMAWLIADLPEARTEDRAKAALQRLLPDAFVRNLATMGRAHFLLFSQSVDDLEQLAAKARLTEGVAAVRLTIIRRIVTNPAYVPWMSGRIRGYSP